VTQTVNGTDLPVSNFISVVRGEKDVYRRACEPSGFIAKKSLVHIVVLKAVFKFLSDQPDPRKQSGSVFGKWDLNTTSKFQEVSYKITNFF